MRQQPSLRFLNTFYLLKTATQLNYMAPNSDKLSFHLSTTEKTLSQSRQRDIVQLVPYIYTKQNI